MSGCAGLNQWTSNSRIVHATAPTMDQPFTFKEARLITGRIATLRGFHSSRNPSTGWQAWRKWHATLSKAWMHRVAVTRLHTQSAPPVALTENSSRHGGGARRLPCRSGRTMPPRCGPPRRTRRALAATSVRPPPYSCPDSWSLDILAIPQNTY